MMTPQAIAQETSLAYGMLNRLTEALRAALGGKVQGEDFSPKLSTLRVMATSFQRHLERLLALEEHDGYLDLVVQRSPHLGRRADALRHEHDRLRYGARRVVSGLERSSPTDPIVVGIVSDELLGLLERLDEHGRQETRLVQEAFYREAGGEG